MIHAREQAKAIGQFFTPKPIIRFMAQRFDLPDPRTNGILRILDPGAGKGCLGLALGKRAIEAGHHVHIVFIEQDPSALRLLHKAVEEFQMINSSKASIEIIKSSFLDPSIAQLRPVDLAILNPPYFKISAKDEFLAAATSRLFKGLPNIYASFMAISLNLLTNGGQMVSITPRSYANGAYFKGFRKYLSDHASLDACHIFESRREAFGDQGVLQENIVTKYTKNRQAPNVAITASGLKDLAADHPPLRVASNLVLPSPECAIRLPNSITDKDILEQVESWTDSLHSLGLRVATGPVVEHRALELIVSPNSASGVPLIRMHNVRSGRVAWTSHHKKDVKFLVRVGKSQKLLIANDPGIIILKRFTSKEEKRRLVAGLPESELTASSEWIALENHLNYVSGSALRDENFSIGLCALLNSKLMDDYFRIISGNTQVNATDLRNTPFPSEPIIRKIGSLLNRQEIQCPDHCSKIVTSILS